MAVAVQGVPAGLLKFGPLVTVLLEITVQDQVRVKAVAVAPAAVQVEEMVRQQQQVAQEARVLVPQQVVLQVRDHPSIHLQVAHFRP